MRSGAKSEAPPGWRSLQLGEERVWTRREDGCLFLFGRGPARGGEAPGERVSRLVTALEGALRGIRWGRQVHGATVRAVSHRAGVVSTRDVGECDALLTGSPALGLLVWTADCVPILLAGGGAVAAVHAGWRGAAAGIGRAAVRRLQRLVGVPAAEVRAFLGPSVGPCHYPVGPEVISALAARGVERDCWVEGNRVDLRGLLAGELTGAGVGRVERVGGCVACSHDLASFRRDGPGAGRQLSLVVRLARRDPSSPERPRSPGAGSRRPL